MPWPRFERPPDLLDRRGVECAHEGVGDLTEIELDCPVCLEKVVLRSRTEESTLFLGVCPCCYARFHVSNVRRNRDDFTSPGYRRPRL